MPLIGSPEDECAGRRLDCRSSEWIRNPALLIPSFRMVFNQDEKSREHKGVTNGSFAPLAVSSSPRADRHCLEQLCQQQLVELPELQLYFFPVVCWTELQTASQNHTLSLAFLGMQLICIKASKLLQLSPAETKSLSDMGL